MLTKLFLLTGAALLLGACATQNGEDLLAADPTPAPTCDTSNVTFALSVMPVLRQNCVSCHSGGLPSGGLNFNSYAQVQRVAVSGSLLGTVNHAPGYPPMPQGGVMLSDCDRAKLRLWVAAGAPNN